MARTDAGPPSRSPWSPSTSVVIIAGSSGTSPNDSYVRPQRSSRTTHTQGAKSQSAPVPVISSAVAAPIRRTRAGSRAAPSPMSCGKIVAPATLLWPCTASPPYIIGTRSGAASAARWRPSVMSAQLRGVFGLGDDPPLDSTDPIR